jgi:ABC-type multidrug transport system ATPase subunit
VQISFSSFSFYVLVSSSCVEATASVDQQTECLLLDTLNEYFHGCTILTVAHRLDTVIENDYIMVMDNGSVSEFGPPGQLIRRGGTFESMVNDTGERMSKSLQYRACKVERKGSMDLMQVEEEVFEAAAERYLEEQGERYYKNVRKGKQVAAKKNTAPRRNLVSKSA